MQDWPVYNMRSDGNYLIAIGENGATVIQAGTNSGQIIGRFSASESNGGSVVANSYVAISTSGLSETSGLEFWKPSSPNKYAQSRVLIVGFELRFQYMHRIHTLEYKYQS